MQQIFSLGLTFVICYILKIENMWLGFVPVMLIISKFKIDKNIIWEIPLAILCFDTLYMAFTDEAKFLLQILILCSTVIFYTAFPRKILLFFAVAFFSLVFENVYWISAVWATLWCSISSMLKCFSVKGYKIICRGRNVPF